LKVRKGISDERIQQARETIVYVGTDTRNDHTGWNVSVEVPIPLHQLKKIEKE
jgi:hypothetical protein